MLEVGRSEDRARTIINRQWTQPTSSIPAAYLV